MGEMTPEQMKAQAEAMAREEFIAATSPHPYPFRWDWGMAESSAGKFLMCAVHSDSGTVFLFWSPDEWENFIQGGAQAMTQVKSGLTVAKTVPPISPNGHG